MDAPSRPRNSPYKEVQVLQLCWDTDIEAGRRNLSAIEKAWKQYHYGVTTVYCEHHCEPDKTPDQSKKDVAEIVFQWRDANDEDETSLDEKPRGQREKLLILTYVGHGGIRKQGAAGKQLVATDETGNLSFSLTVLENEFRDHCGRCDVLTILECCYGDFEHDVAAPTEEEEVYVPVKDWKTMETLAAGNGEIYIDMGREGSEDFLQRLARDLMDHQEGWTVQERADRIQKDGWDSPGSYRRIDEREGEDDVSIVLAPMRSGSLTDSMPGARLWDKDANKDLRKMGIRP